MANTELGEYPQAATPRKSHSTLGIVIASIGAAIVLTGSLWGASAELTSVNAAAALHAAQVAQASVPAAPAGEGTTADEQATMTQSDADGAQAIVTENAVLAEQAKVAAAKAAAARAAAVKAAAEQDNDGSSGAPAGTPVPFIKSNDPNNADGGDYEDPGLFCASRHASTIGGVPVCD